MNKTDLFNYLGAPLANQRWSWAVLLIEVGAVSGLRESELFGIHFPDIDFPAGRRARHAAASELRRSPAKIRELVAIRAATAHDHEKAE